MTRKACLFVLGVLIVGFPGVSFAALDNLDIGGDIRELFVFTENTFDLNDDYDDQDDFFRTEAHIWFEASLADNVKAKVSIEADRDWESNASIEGEEFGSTSFGGNGDLNVFLEEAWIKIAYIWDTRLSLTLGRQFLKYGDGFIVGDAQPDVPASIAFLGEYEQDPFDAIVASLDFDTIVVDLVYASAVEERSEDEDSDLYGMNLAWSGIEGHELSFYYWFMRTEDSSDARYRKLDNWTSRPVREDIHVFGLRAEGEFAQSLSYAAEIAYQMGEVESGNDDADIAAFGGHVGLMWRPDMEISPFVGFDYFFLQGDDDPDLESEWRQMFSDHTYGEIARGIVSTNAHIFNLTLGLDNIADGKWSAMLKYYYLLMVEEEGSLGWTSQATSGPYPVYAYTNGEDDELGHEVDLFINYNFSESLTAGVAGGIFLPGDAFDDVYASGSADEAYFVRGEVALKF